MKAEFARKTFTDILVSEYESDNAWEKGRELLKKNNTKKNTKKGTLSKGIYQCEGEII
ncbi:MAG: hypothetical protein GXZ08_03400 [Tissierellia bacterium]|nr:hypothetical protein [Tissierellia bacterium]